MSSTEEMDVMMDITSDNVSIKNQRRGRGRAQGEALASDEVQEDINSLLQNVPEISNVFTVSNNVGSGTFSSVYVAKLKNHPEVQDQFALKHIIPTSAPSRIESELKCLQKMGGSHNVMGVQACIRNKDHVVIVMPYFHHDKFQEYIRDVTVEEVQDYMKNLFIALKCVHDHNMIHRDVKPSNFLVNRKSKRYSLVDFGLAQDYLPDKSTNRHHVATPAVSTSKTTQQTQAVPLTSGNRRVPLSPKQLKSTESFVNVSGSPRKRKILAKSAKESPKEQGRGKPETSSVKRNELVTAKNDKNKENPDNVKKLMITPPPTQFGKLSKKSPRRQLLMKRTGVDREHHSGVMVSSSGKSVYKSVAPTACRCFGLPSVCSICLSRRLQVAPRAGTPGFRSPEVLLKCTDQTTALDIWSAGVIFLSLLSGRYPFFKADDDMSALAQIVSVVGSEEMIQAAKTYGKDLIMSPMMQRVDFQIMCLRLRGCYNSEDTVTKKQNHKNSWFNVPDSAWDLLARTLDPNPYTRITAADALSHPFLTDS